MHLVETMAYTGQRPWHGLGNKLAPGQSTEQWRQAAGMDWAIEESEVRFVSGHGGIGTLQAYPDQKVLYRSDTKRPLAVVSKRFQVVQPGEILEFYRDLTEVGGFELETAGVLAEGRKVWALARTGQSAMLKGDDQVDAYLLLATACDDTLATTVQFTSVRVVCNNTLKVAISDKRGAIKVPHRSQFDAGAIKQQLGLAVEPWTRFVARMKDLVVCPVDPDSVEGLLRRVLVYPGAQGQVPVVNEQAVRAARALYGGGGKGAGFASSRGTAWGLLNSVTEYVDHHRRGHSDDHRRNAAWFGQGAHLKQRAWDELLQFAT